MATPEQNFQVIQELAKGGAGEAEYKNFLLNLSEQEFNELADWQEQSGLKISDLGNTENISDTRQMTTLPTGPSQTQVAGGKDPSSLLSGILGPTVRGAIEGTLGLPMMAAGALFGEGIGDGAKVTDLLGDAVGARYAESPGERVYQDVVAGAAGGALTGGTGALAKQALKSGSTSLGARALAPLAAGRTGQVASGALGGGAGGIARENGASTETQILASLLAGLSPQITSSGLKQGFTKGVPKEELANRAENFAAAGTTPTIGQLTGGPRAQGFESLLGDFYGSSGKMRDFALTQEANIGKTLADEADSLASQATPFQLGQLIEDQYKTVAKPRLKATRESLQQNIADNVDADAIINVDNYEELIKSLAEVNPSLKSQLNDTILNPNAKDFAKTAKGVKDDLNASVAKQIKAGIPEEDAIRGLPFQAVRELKTKVGQQLDDSIISTKKISDADLRRITGALSEDIKEFVKSQGANAEEAFNAMNRWEVQYHKDAKLIRSVLNKNGGPEAVYNAMFRGTNNGPSTVRSVYDVLDDSAKTVMTSAMIRKLAKSSDANAKDFELQSFYTNYSKLDQDAKDVVFGHLGKEYQANMEKVYQASKTIIKEGKEFGKASNGGGKLGVHTLLGALTGGYFYNGADNLAQATGAIVAGAGASIAGSRLFAKYMTNPKAVKWLASNALIPPSSIPSAINILLQDARKSQDQEYVDFAEELAQELEGTE